MAVPEQRKKVIGDLVDKISTECSVVNFSSLSAAAVRREIFVCSSWDFIFSVSGKVDGRYYIIIPHTLSPKENIFTLAERLGYVLLNHPFDGYSFANQSDERGKQSLEESAYFRERLTGISSFFTYISCGSYLHFSGVFLRRPLAFLRQVLYDDFGYKQRWPYRFSYVQHILGIV